jgi:arginine decarboxylase
MMAAWDADEFVLDPSRITLSIGRTGYDGDTFKREQLMDRHGVQINETSRNTVLFMTNIGTTRSSVAFLVEVLVKIARELDEHISEMGLGERSRFEQRVRRLTARAGCSPTSAASTLRSATTPASRTPRRATCGARSTCRTTTPTVST